MTNIGRNAFQYCSSLTSIAIPDSVTSIGDYAFSGCISLTSVTIPDGVTSIGDRAFENCSSLTSIAIPDGVTSIGYYAFNGETAKNVYITDIAAWCNIAFDNDSANPLYDGGVLRLNGEIVFDMNIPAEAGAVGAYAFYNAERIRNVVIEEGVTEIGEYAFYSMYRLDSVTIPKSVTSIGNYAFASSSAYHRGNLEYIYYGGTEKDWLSITKGTNWDQNAGDYILVCQPETEKFDVMGEIFESDATENFADNVIVAGAEVTLEGEAGEYTLTAADGTFAFEEIAEGEYTLTITMDGYITVVKDILVDQSMYLTIVMDLDAVNVLTGKVTIADDNVDFSDNLPLAGAEVTITRLSSTNPFTDTVTTASDGTYSFSGLTIGRYTITVVKDGYKTVTQQFYVYMHQLNIQNIVLEAIPGTNVTDGNAAGKIIDSVTGAGVSGLTLYIYSGVNVMTGETVAVVTTSELGRYVTPDLAAGNYTVLISDERSLADENRRYNRNSFIIKVLSDKLIDNQNGYVTNNNALAADSLRIVLTWGATPRDLDSHLDIDTVSGSGGHTWYSNKKYTKDGVTMADLDLDDTTSYGPETTTVYQMEEGVYTFYVHDYTNRTSSSSTALATSGAKVTVYVGNSETAAYVFYVPDVAGTLWKVFSYDSTTGILTPYNTVTYYSSPSGIGQ